MVDAQRPHGGSTECVLGLAGHGRRKMLFGTNYPMIMPAKALEHLDELSLDDEARRLFLGENACRVLKL